VRDRGLAADLPVELAERGREPAARGGEGGEAERGEHAGGADVPGVGHHQRRARPVQLTEGRHAADPCTSGDQEREATESAFQALMATIKLSSAATSSGRELGGDGGVRLVGHVRDWPRA
jgi:hypothetical protein